MKILQVISILAMVMVDDVVSKGSIWGIGRRCNDEASSYLGATVVDGNTALCSGSFIAPKWMITAAHCCEVFQRHSFKKKFTVVAGKTKWLEDVDQTSGIQKVFVPADFKSSPVTSDICLVELTKLINPSPKVKMSKLVSTKEFEEMLGEEKCNLAVTAGFRDRPPGRSGRQGNDVNAECVNMRVVGRNRCQDDAFMKNFVSETAFCLVNDFGRSCLSDSAGPVFCEDLQIGVVSSDVGCRGSRYSAIFTRVDLYKPYFEKVMNITLDKKVYAPEGLTE